MIPSQSPAPRALTTLTLVLLLGFLIAACQVQLQVAGEQVPVWPKPKSFSSGGDATNQVPGKVVVVVPGPDFFKLTHSQTSNSQTSQHSSSSSVDAASTSNEIPRSALSRRLSDHLQQAGLHMHDTTPSAEHWVKDETTEEDESKHTSMSVLDHAFRRYMWITFPRKIKFASNNNNNNNQRMRGIDSSSSNSDSSSDDSNVIVNSLSVSVQDMDETHPTLGHDESYTLHICSETGNAQLSAKTVWGALHGLQTFSQLVVYDFDSERYELAVGLPFAVDDAPRFPQRGLMIDTARHFEPVSVLLRLIASLPNSKINVLHWHISDEQSFPLESKTFPKLWQGAFSKQERYTTQDARVIVEFARLLGIRVIPELDMPGHAAAWCAGYPEICPSPTCLQPLNVANNKTFEVIEGLMDEFAIGLVHKEQEKEMRGKSSLVLEAKDDEGPIFPDEMMHLGGDEVHMGCWETVSSIVEWRKERNMTSKQAYGYFSQRVAAAAIKRHRRPVQWVEVFNEFGSKLDKKTVVHVWRENAFIKPVVQAGYNALVSTPAWYLDHIHSWENVYDNEPCEGLSVKECGLVLGGHGELWGEKVDPSDVFNTLWPRLAAIGERLWSHDLGMHTNDTLVRLEKFRCLLLQRGVGAGPVQSEIGRDAPPNPGGCAAQ